MNTFLRNQVILSALVVFHLFRVIIYPIGAIGAIMGIILIVLMILNVLIYGRRPA